MYNIVLTAILEHIQGGGDALCADRALSILRDMKHIAGGNVNNDSELSRIVRPTVTTYNLVLRALAYLATERRDGKAGDKAISLFYEMKKSDKFWEWPNSESYSAIFLALTTKVENGDVRAIEVYLLLMDSARQSPDSRHVMKEAQFKITESFSRFLDSSNERAFRVYSAYSKRAERLNIAIDPSILERIMVFLKRRVDEGDILASRHIAHLRKQLQHQSIVA